tara:strand:- start:55 stop:888 length:834 start_codon:yes stop_codon:yes gene_type:complete
MNKLNDGLAKMFKGGVIMDVTSIEQALLAEKAGACAVMALDMIPSDIRKVNGVCRMADLNLIRDIKEAVSIPVMAKCRIGHTIEAAILQEAGVDFIDESEVLTPADYDNQIDKKKFDVPFVCGAKNLGEALRRINEGASMIRTKGEAGTGDVSQAVNHIKTIKKEIKELKKTADENLFVYASDYNVPVELVEKVKKLGKLPVVNFAAGGIATPADAALAMHLGSEGVFVGSGIFSSKSPESMAESIVNATTYYEKPGRLYEISLNCGGGMTGMNLNK